MLFPVVLQIKEALRSTALILLLAVTITACSKDTPVEPHLGDNRDSQSGLEQQLALLQARNTQMSLDDFDDIRKEAVVALYNRRDAHDKQVSAVFNEVQAIIDAALPKVREDGIAAVASVMKVNNEIVLAEASREGIAYEKLYEEVVMDYASIVLNPRFTTNGDYTQNTGFKILLEKLNRAIVAVLKANPQFIHDKKILELYWNVFTFYCDDKHPTELRDCGKGTKYFKSDQNTSRILQFYAWSVLEQLKKASELRAEAEKIPVPPLLTSGLSVPAHRASKAQKIAAVNRTFYRISKKYNQIVKFALATANASDQHEESPDLAGVLYLNGAVFYSQYLDSLPESGAKNTAITIHANMLDSILRNSKDLLDNRVYREQFKIALISNDFWRNYSRKRWNEQPSWYPAMFELATDSRVRLGAGVEEAQRKSLTENDILGGNGFFPLMELLKNGRNTKITTNLELDLDFQINDALYVTDQVFRGHWNVQEAGQFWNSGELAPGQTKEQRTALLVNTVSNYLKFHVANMIITTNEFMGHIFSDEDNEASSGTMFRNAIEKSTEIGGQWLDLANNKKFELKALVTQVAKSADQGSQTPEFHRLDRDFKNLSKNIKVLAVYPNMIVLAYMMAKEGFKVEVNTWWGTMTFDAETIINWIFAQISSQPTRPWFKFGNDLENIKKFENLFSVYFALKTDIFYTIGEALRKNPNSNADLTIPSFFQVIIEKFLNSELGALKTNTERIETKFLATLNDFEKSIVACGQEEQVAAGARSFRSYPRIPVSFDNIQKSTVVPSYSNTESVLTPIFNFYDNVKIKEFEIFRYQVQNKTLFLNTMIDLLKAYYTDLVENAPDGEKDGLKKRQQVVLDLIDDSFDKINDVKRRYYSTYLKRFNEAGNCLHTFKKMEKDTQFLALDAEISHLKRVHAGLAAIAAQVEANPPPVKGDTEHDADFAPRLEAYNSGLSEFLEAETSKVTVDNYLHKPGDVEIYEHFVVEGEKISYMASDWDFRLRLANNLERVARVTVTRKSSAKTLTTGWDLFDDGDDAEHMLSLDYVEDEDAFVTESLKSTYSKYLKWSESSTDEGTWTLGKSIAKLEMMNELHFARSIGIFKKAFEVCRAADAPATGTVCDGTSLTEAEVTEEDIVDEVFGIADLMHINSEYEYGQNRNTQKDFMLMLGKHYYYHADEIATLFLEKQGTETPKPLLEKTFKMTLNMMGFLNEAKKAAETLNALTTFYTDPKKPASKIRESELLFLWEEDQVMNSVLKVYRPAIIGLFGAVDKLKAAVAARAKADRDTVYEYVYKIDLNNPESIGSTLTSEMGSNGNPIYIEPIRLEDFENTKKKFHRETKCIFAPELDYCNSEAE